MKTLAKSLHTVTVLVRFANFIQRTKNETAESAIRSAMIELGHGDSPDDYGLAAAALAQLKKLNASAHAKANA